jgi:hypothetical protein
LIYPNISIYKCIIESHQFLFHACSRLADAEAQLKLATEQEEEVEELVRAARNVLKEVEEDCSKLLKTLNNEESDLMVLRQKLHETLQKARVAEVELPLSSEEDADTNKDVEAEDSQMSSSARSSKRRLSQHATQESLTHFSQREDTKVAKDRRDAGKVDFSSMDEELRKSLPAAEEDKLRKKFESKISKLSAEIEGIAPNMKVSISI